MTHSPNPCNQVHAPIVQCVTLVANETGQGVLVNRWNYATMMELICSVSSANQSGTQTLFASCHNLVSGALNVWVKQSLKALVPGACIWALLMISVIVSAILSLLYLFPVLGTTTAPRAFELLTRFKQSQFGTDLRQCSSFSNSTEPSFSFSITLFIPSIFLLSWMRRCWLAKTHYMTIQPPCSWKYTSSSLERKH